MMHLDALRAGRDGGAGRDLNLRTAHLGPRPSVAVALGGAESGEGDLVRPARSLPGPFPARGASSPAAGFLFSPPLGLLGAPSAPSPAEPPSHLCSQVRPPPRPFRPHSPSFLRASSSASREDFADHPTPLAPPSPRAAPVPPRTPVVLSRAHGCTSLLSCSTCSPPRDAPRCPLPHAPGAPAGDADTPEAPPAGDPGRPARSRWGRAGGAGGEGAGRAHANPGVTARPGPPPARSDRRSGPASRPRRVPIGGAALCPAPPFPAPPPIGPGARRVGRPGPRRAPPGRQRCWAVEEGRLGWSLLLAA